MRFGRPRWTPCPEALDLLDSEGGPFDRSAYRRSWTEAFPGTRDVSYGGQTRNGTRAAVSLIQWEGRVESTPNNYGSLLATRPLAGFEARSFLEAARLSCGAHRLIARSVPLRPTTGACHVGARIVGWTSAVYVGKGEAMEARYAQGARHSIRKAMQAGAEAALTSDPEGFLPLYMTASAGHWMQYPEVLIRALAKNEVAQFFDVRLGADTVASVMVLTSATHWMAWLAAQNARGRAIDANYFAVGAVLAAAQQARVAGVNLGISQGMPGVAQFKRRFDAVDVPVVEYRVSSWMERIRVGTTTSTRLGVRRARRLLRRK